MRVLVACEESQAVTKELRELGHEAYSCDLLPCSGGHPEWHYQEDVAELIKQKWDMIIAFPPCTYLTVSGLHWNKRNQGRAKKTEEAIDFFMMFANADCDKIAIENPVGCISSRWRKPNQIIHPYHFGSDASKKTCLWLKGLPNLNHTEIIKPRIVGGKRRWANQMDNGQNITLNERGKVCGWNTSEIKKIRSKTFPGIAKAMANQWTSNVSNQITLELFGK
tara:strand:+ start:49 stop:714 length:666 start_codon:yes stop_codon:yes gene_type:complete